MFDSVPRAPDTKNTFCAAPPLYVFPSTVTLVREPPASELDQSPTSTAPGVPEKVLPSTCRSLPFFTCTGQPLVPLKLLPVIQTCEIVGPVVCTTISCELFQNWLLLIRTLLIELPSTSP